TVSTAPPRSSSSRSRRSATSTVSRADRPDCRHEARPATSAGRASSSYRDPSRAPPPTTLRSLTRSPPRRLADTPSRLGDFSLVIGLIFAPFVRQPGWDVRQLGGGRGVGSGCATGAWPSRRRLGRPVEPLWIDGFFVHRGAAVGLVASRDG